MKKNRELEVWWDRAFEGRKEIKVGFEDRIKNLTRLTKWFKNLKVGLRKSIEVVKKQWEEKVEEVEK